MTTTHQNVLQRYRLMVIFLRVVAFTHNGSVPYPKGSLSESNITNSIEVYHLQTDILIGRLADKGYERSRLEKKTRAVVGAMNRDCILKERFL